MSELVAQRLYALALGYEDLNDHAVLRGDPLLAVAANQPDPLGTNRAASDPGRALAAPAGKPPSADARSRLGENAGNFPVHQKSWDGSGLERYFYETSDQLARGGLNNRSLGDMRAMSLKRDGDLTLNE